MDKRRVGPFEVAEIGLGCMGLSHGYGPTSPRERAEQVLLGALDAGYDFFDTAVVYGLGHNESLVGEVLGPHRSKIVLASKCGMTIGDKRQICGRPARHGRHAPQATLSPTSTRSPVSVRVPAVSCPKR